MLETTASAAETKKLGEKFATRLEKGDAVLLTGEIGSGKTTFLQGLARGLGITGQITSPSFNIIKHHPGDHVGLTHIDLYRLRDLSAEADSAGLLEALSDEKNVTVIEWADRLNSGFLETVRGRVFKAQFNYGERETGRVIEIEQA